MAKTSLEVLELARKRIAAGWAQGDWVAEAPDSDPYKPWCYCAAGAMGYGTVSETPQETCDAIDAFAYFGLGLTDIHGDVVDEITTWNDHEDRTQAEVLAAFDRAIAGVREAAR